MPLIAAALAVIALLAGGFVWNSNRNTGGGGAPSPLAAEWSRQQQAVLDTISRLRATIETGRSAGQQRQWQQVQRMADDVVPLVRDGKSAIDRLQSLAHSEPQRQTVRDYAAQIDTLAGMASDMRAEAQRGITRDEEDRLRATADTRRRDAEARRLAEEEARRRSDEDDRRRREQARLEEERRLREATPPPPPVERTWIVHSRRWVQGDGYNRPPPVVRDLNTCARMCVDDARCRMFEHASDDKTKQPICNLYDHTKLAPGAGNATVGVMR